MDSIFHLTFRSATLLIVFLLYAQVDGQVLQQQSQQQQQQQPAVVGQPTSDVSQDRTAVQYNVPAAYDYTYLTKPYGYSAYRNYDTTQTQQQGYSNNGYGQGGVSNYGGLSGIISSIWPLILLPFIIFIGLSIFFPMVVQYPNQYGRRSTSEPTDEASFILQSVLHAIEHDKCLEKTACDLGLYSRHLGSSKVTVLGFVEKFAPSNVLPFMEIMRKAANHKGDTKDFCDRYNCDATKAE